MRSLAALFLFMTCLPASAPAASDNTTVVRGFCGVISSAANPLAEPCIHILLVITDSKGKELLKTRTSGQGEIEFSLDPPQPYRIQSGSRYYDLVAPKELLVVGSQRLEVQLQQK